MYSFYQAEKEREGQRDLEQRGGDYRDLQQNKLRG